MKPYPLQWPHGRQRTRVPETPRTSVSLADARDHLLKQLDLMGAMKIIISSNAVLRRNGLPLSRQPVHMDNGVAIYFLYRKVQYCISCDLNDTISGNIRAIGLAVADLRSFCAKLGIPPSAQLNHLFVIEQPQQKQQLLLDAPRKPLPERDPDDWRHILQLHKVYTWADVVDNYNRLIQEHPDSTSINHIRIRKAYETALQKRRFKIRN